MAFINVFHVFFCFEEYFRLDSIQMCCINTTDLLHQSPVSLFTAQKPSSASFAVNF